MSKPLDDNARLMAGDLKPGADPEADAEAMGADGTQAPDPFEGHWRTLAAAGIDLADPPPKRRWLLKRGGTGVLPLGKAGVLAASGGAGKTMALVQLAYAVATGTDWLGTFQVEAPGNVLALLGEEDDEEVRRRFHHAAMSAVVHGEGFAEASEAERYQRQNVIGAKHRKHAAERIVAVPLAGIPVALTARDAKGNTTETAALEHLRRRLAEREWSLIIIDPLSRFGSDDVETDNAAATRLVQAIESLVNVKGAGGPTVLVAHHSGKITNNDGSPKVRGSSAITDGFRWAATLSPRDASDDVHGAVLHCFKSNYAMPFSDVYLVKPKDAGGVLVRARDEQREAMAKAPIAADEEDRKRRLTLQEQNAANRAKDAETKAKEADTRAKAAGTRDKEAATKAAKEARIAATQARKEATAAKREREKAEHTTPADAAAIDGKGYFES